MYLHLVLHLLHHFLHPDCLSFVLAVDLLFDVFLHVHIIEGANHLAHIFELVDSLPELLELVILDEALTLVEVKDEWLELVLLDPLVIRQVVLKVSGDLSSKFRKKLEHKQIKKYRNELTQDFPYIARYCAQIVYRQA